MNILFCIRIGEYIIEDIIFLKYLENNFNVFEGLIFIFFINVFKDFYNEN